MGKISLIEKRPYINLILHNLEDCHLVLVEEYHYVLMEYWCPMGP